MAGADTARSRAMARADQAANAPEQEGQETVHGLLERLKPQLARALPQTMSADKFARIVLTTVNDNPQLKAAEPRSLMAACMLSAQLGLEPGPLGHCYFVPFKDQGVPKVQFIVGYKGMIHLARNSGDITSIEAREVRENDDFDFEYGLNPVLRHKPARDDRGKLTYFYGVAHFTGGGHYFEVLPLEEIERRRERSATGKGSNPRGPWATDYPQMGKKSTIRAMFPFLPVSTDAARAVEADEGVVSDLPLHTSDVQVTHVEGPVVDVEANGHAEADADAAEQESAETQGGDS